MIVSPHRHNNRTRERRCWFCGASLKPKKDKTCPDCGLSVTEALAKQPAKKIRQ